MTSIHTIQTTASLNTMVAFIRKHTRSKCEQMIVGYPLCDQTLFLCDLRVLNNFQYFMTSGNLVRTPSQEKKKCSCLPYKVIVWLPSEMALTIFNWTCIHVETKLAWHEDSKLDEKEHLHADVTSCSTPKRICAVKTTNLIKNLEKECITYSTESLHGLATNNL